MRIGLDATNLVSGGGLTHLTEFLTCAHPKEHKFSKLVVWVRESTLQKLPKQPWIEYHTNTLISGPFYKRLFWLKFKFDTELKDNYIDLLFVPGGSIFTSFSPVVTMSRNMLPFEKKERRRYGFSFVGIRLWLLFFQQLKSFKKATGLIFLSNYARKIISPLINKDITSELIAHGLNEAFLSTPKPSKNINEYTWEKPFKLLYVSIIDVYKHQKTIVEAIIKVREKGFPLELEIIGSSYKPEKIILDKTIKINKANGFIKLKGEVNYSDLPKYYNKADGFIFASSCENLPNILLEAMASGLPILCSNKDPMPEVLKKSGVYFNPEDPDSIKSAIIKFLEDSTLRSVIAQQSNQQARQYSWKKCTNSTFEFLHKVYNETISHENSIRN